MSSVPEVRRWDDNDFHSVKVDQVTRLSRTEAAHRRLAQVREDLNRLDDEAERVFRRMEEAQALCLEVGSRFEPILSPVSFAAHGAWLRERKAPKRLEITQLSEAPIGPESE